MNKYVVVILGLHFVSSAPPIRLEIDCGSQETDRPQGLFKSRSPEPSTRLNIESLCSVIRGTIPKSIKDGKFVLIGETADQSRASDNQQPVSVKPPKGFVPKLKTSGIKLRKLGPKFRNPKIKVPNIKVPNLKPSGSGSLAAPVLGAPMNFPSFTMRAREEESSAEKMEQFKKGVQKMLHLVKVLGQIDSYVSERARIIVDMLSKTFTE